jgi:hypothetical protein
MRCSRNDLFSDFRFLFRPNSAALRFSVPIQFQWWGLRIVGTDLQQKGIEIQRPSMIDKGRERETTRVSIHLLIYVILQFHHFLP